MGCQEYNQPWVVYVVTVLGLVHVVLGLLLLLEMVVARAPLLLNQYWKEKGDALINVRRGAGAGAAGRCADVCCW